MTEQEIAILRTVIYAALFDYPLTIDQLHRSLIECEMTPQEILAVYDRSIGLQRVVEYRDGFFFPIGRVDLIAERRRREARSRAFLARHRLVLRLVCAIPYTRLVALSGSVAHLNLEPDGDLDLFIITRGPRVWMVTLAILVLTKLLRCRRVICANFIVADTHLRVEQQDVFSANQVIHLKPLIGAALLDDFRAANPFVARLYPNARRYGPKACAPSTPPILQPFRSDDALAKIKRACERLLDWPSPLVEWTARTAYGWHLRRRARAWRSPDQVRLQSDYLKLHTRSHRQSILERFNAAFAAAATLAIEAADEAAIVFRTAAR